MGITKLNQEEQQELSRRVTELSELHQQAIAKEAEAFQYDWQQLDTALNPLKHIK